jgi:hypothetical protein
MDIQLLAEGSTSYGYAPEPWPQVPLLLEPCPQEPYPWAVRRLASESLRISLCCGEELAKRAYSYIHRCSSNGGGEDECQSACSDEELKSRTY